MKSIFSPINRIRAKSVIAALIVVAVLSACGKEEHSVEVSSSVTVGTRSNESVVLEPKKGGTNICGIEDFAIDYTNASEGYLVATYTGQNDNAMFQITAGSAVTYTYYINSGDTVIPLCGGTDTYKLVGFEGIGDNQYATLFTENLDIEVTNEFGPFLYPNEYVKFTADSKAVAKAREIASGCTCDLEVIAAMYNFITDNVTYDHDEAETVEKGYLPDVDEVLATQKGICFDYAALLTAMLRSQRIPTKMELGYAGDAYHAWVSTYVEDIGWINGMIQFDGVDWTLMDPTFAANTNAKDLKKFIGDGSNYTTKYEY